MGSILSLFDQWLERTPGVKLIYTSTRDFFEAFAGNKRKFNRSVLANVFGPDVWIIGFLTDEEMEKFEMGSDKVAVYVPQGYNFAGQLYILPREKVKKIEKSIENLKNKTAKIYFLVQDTKGNPKASVNICENLLRSL